MEKIIHIEGMSCGHCKAAVEKALGDLTEVKEVNVNLEEKTATLELFEEVSNDTLTATVEGAGYVVNSIE